MYHLKFRFPKNQKCSLKNNDYFFLNLILPHPVTFFKRLFEMKKTTTLVLGLMMAAFSGLFAQQDPMVTKYMFNSLAFNPGYAGANDHLTMGVLHRSQWVGLKGAPTTDWVFAHSPLKNERVGVGFELSNDQIGPVGSSEVFASYAYRIPMGKFRLAIGLQAGAVNWRFDRSKVSLVEITDQAFDIKPSRILPNFGAGVYLSSKRFYTGFGCPKLVEYDLRNINNPTTAINARSYRHYFATIGAAFPLGSENLIFKPSALVKSVSWLSSARKEKVYQNVGAPTEANIDLSFLIQNQFWIGSSFRTSLEKFSNNRSSFDSVDFWASYNMSNGFRIGAAYDYSLTKIQTVSSGSFELMLGYEFDYHTKKVVTPRYF
jgi:type IX secretion system PorP/SprF family membrane protein